MRLKDHLHITITACLILSLTGSCGRSTSETERDYLTSAIDELGIPAYTRWIVIMPGLGCHGCIQEAEAFMKENVERQDILFVLTSISSLKILQQKIGVQVKDLPNVYIDREEAFMLPTANNIYPCIVRIESGKIVAHEFQSPSNRGAFMKLQDTL